MARRTRARNRRGQFTKGGGSRAIVRYRSRPVVKYRTRTRVVRSRRRGAGRGGVTTDIKELGWQFAANAGYGYLREGGTQNFNEFLDKVPGADSLGKDLRNALVFWALDRYAVKSVILRRLAMAAVARSGYTFGASKFSKLQGDDDLDGSM